MDFKSMPLRYKIIAGVFALVFILLLSGGLAVNRQLKRDIKDREKKIEALEESKKPILKELKAKIDEIKRQDSIILVLSKKEVILETTIKNLKNESNRIKKDYVNSSLSERVGIFSRLATQNDSIRQ